MLQRIIMNNKGFTLLELLAVIVIISIISVTSVSFIGTTLSSSKEESYKLLKDNILTAGYSYISECTAGTLECDFTFDDKITKVVSVIRIDVSEYTAKHRPMPKR